VRPWLAVIGIGEDGLVGLVPTARALVETAEVLVGGERHHALVAGGGAERLVWERPLSRTIEAIAARRGRRVAVLASGDPMWFGIGVTLLRRFAVAETTVIPQPSAFSLVASRLGWPLAECRTLTLHGRPLDRLRLELAPKQRLLVLSEDGGTPWAVARFLTVLGWGASPMTVLAHLGGASEEMVEDEARTWGERRVPDLNTIAIECRAGPDARAWSRFAGLPDEVFEHDGQLTKREVRAATLAALRPLPGETLWDVGAGCGSVAIEWLRADGRRRAVAFEHRPERAAAIARNAANLGVPELRIVVGTAPAALAGLPSPDAVFVGGGIGDAALLPAVWAALPGGGRLVANVVTTEGEARLFEWQTQHGGTLTRIAVSRAEPAGPRHLWRALAPVTQLAAVKPA
jgi:precorrin-6B C5,15-methyltransferase / cobalt-precorrin-6B C5,C15-methyltransferase